LSAAHIMGAGGAAPAVSKSGAQCRDDEICSDPQDLSLDTQELIGSKAAHLSMCRLKCFAVLFDVWKWDL